MSVALPLNLTVQVTPPETTFVSVGSRVRLHLYVTDADTRVPADPDTLTLTTTPPYTAPTVDTFPALPLVREAQGIYHADVTLDAAGKWRFQFIATLDATECGTSTTELVANANAWW